MLGYLSVRNIVDISNEIYMVAIFPCVLFSFLIHCSLFSANALLFPVALLISDC